MADLLGQPKKIAGVLQPELTPTVIEEQATLGVGMISSIDPADVPKGAWSLARNCRIDYDFTKRRDGYTIPTNVPTKPDSNKIRLLLEYQTTRFSFQSFRFTNGGIHRLLNNAWLPIVGEWQAEDSELIEAVIIGNKIIIANGIQKLQLIDTDGNTIDDLAEDAPQARFLTEFADRAIAANRGNTPEGRATVFWSANQVYDLWTPTPGPDGDLSAGQQTLESSSSSRVDDISGVFHIGNVLVIPRNKSLWLATRQPIASNPLNFYEGATGVGCDTPSLIAVGANGLFFVSVEHNDVFHYVPGNYPESLALPISQNDLLDGMIEPNLAFMAYNKFTSELTFGLTRAGTDVIRLWVYNTRRGSGTSPWYYNELVGASAAAVLSIPTAYTPIDDLVGTIDGLSGTIDSLSVTPIIVVDTALGTDDGEILTEDATADFDEGDTPFTMELRSKEFRFFRDETLTSEVKVTFDVTIAGDIAIEYSKDNGVTWVTIKTVSFGIGAKQLLRFKKLIRARRLMWRLLATDGDFKFVESETYVYPSGESR